MDGLSARVRSRRSRVRGDDSRRRRSRRFGVFLFIRLLRGRRPARLLAPRDPRVRRPAAAAAALARDASRGGRQSASRGCRIVGRGVDDARVSSGATDCYSPFSVATCSTPSSPSQGSPTRETPRRSRRSTSPRWRARRRRRRARRPARRTPRRGVGVHSSRRKDRRSSEEQKNAFVAAAGCAAGNLVAETVGREAAVAVCRADGLRGGEERGGGASRGRGRWSRRGGRRVVLRGFVLRAVSSAASWHTAFARDEERSAGNEWTRRVALHLSLDAWVTRRRRRSRRRSRDDRRRARHERRGRDGARRRDARAILCPPPRVFAEASFAARRDHDGDDDDDGGGGGCESTRIPRGSFAFRTSVDLG